MKVHYNATLSSSNKQIDGMPMQLEVGSTVTCKIRDVQPLCKNATYAEREWYKDQVESNTVNG